MSAEARVGFIPGDNIGPVLTYEAALPVASKGAEIAGLELEFVPILAGSQAYVQTGGETFLPDSSVELARRMEAVIKAPMGGPPGSGDPMYKGLEVATILPLRERLGVYANLRPLKILGEVGVQISPLPDDRVEGADVMIVRELSGDVYYGKSSRGVDKETGERWAVDEMSYTDTQVERIIKKAVEIAKGRQDKLTWVHKDNVLEGTGSLWQEVFDEVMAESGDGLETAHLLVDATAAALIKKLNKLETVVTSNLFGDILTDEGAEILGSIGLGPSASLGEGSFGLYEPMGGAAWDVDPAEANPVGMILSVAMMFRHTFDRPETADLIEQAVEAVLNGHYMTNDLLNVGKKRLGGIIGKAVNTEEFSQMVMKKMDELAA